MAYIYPKITGCAAVCGSRVSISSSISASSPVITACIDFDPAHGLPTRRPANNPSNNPFPAFAYPKPVPCSRNPRAGITQHHPASPSITQHHPASPSITIRPVQTMGKSVSDSKKAELLGTVFGSGIGSPSGDVCAWAGSITDSTTGLFHPSGIILPVATIPPPATRRFNIRRRAAFLSFSDV